MLGLITTNHSRTIPTIYVIRGEIPSIVVIRTNHTVLLNFTATLYRVRDDN